MLIFASEAVIPLRAEPREGSEMVSQWLFGERGIRLEASGSWLRVQGAEDGYEGWLDAAMVMQLDSDEVIAAAPRFITQGGLIVEDGSVMHLPTGCRWPSASDTLVVGGRRWWLGTETQVIGVQPATACTELAHLYLHTPYLWGGRSSWGIDCSGLTQAVSGMCGVKLPRDSGQQAREGIEIDYEERRPGDLAFFGKNNHERVTHVGFIDETRNIIHASGKVRQDALSPAGIHRAGSDALTHHLISIRRCW